MQLREKLSQSMCTEKQSRSCGCWPYTCAVHALLQVHASAHAVSDWFDPDNDVLARLGVGVMTACITCISSAELVQKLVHDHGNSIALFM